MSGFIQSSAGSAAHSCLMHLHTHCEALGFEYSAFGRCLPVPVTRPRKAIYSNFPDSWQRHYQASGYVDIDPTLTHGLRSSAPAIWNEEFFAGARQLWDDAQPYGLCHGVVQPRHEPGGAYSVLVLARSHTPITPGELEVKGPSLQWLAHWAHTKIPQSGEIDRLGPEDIELTGREVEVLRWTADGKTALDIAGFMGVSERTVNFSINAATIKLNASNKTSAAVRAALLGLLW